MKSMNLPKISTHKINFSHTSNSSSGNNILNRNFSVNTPNTVWVSDITYIRLNGHFAYLCVVIDLFSRKVISYALSTKIDSNLVINAFLSAFNKRNKPQNLIFHSDNGSQYTSLWLLDGFLTNAMLFNLFRKKAVLMIMLLPNLSLNF